MPLNVRSAGHYQLAPHGAENRGPGDFLQVFWSVAGSGTFTLDDASHPIRPGTLFYYVAGEPHQLLAGPEGWDYRWLTLMESATGPFRTPTGSPASKPPARVPRISSSNSTPAYKIRPPMANSAPRFSATKSFSSPRRFIPTARRPARTSTPPAGPRPGSTCTSPTHVSTSPR